MTAEDKGEWVRTYFYTWEQWSFLELQPQVLFVQ